MFEGRQRQRQRQNRDFVGEGRKRRWNSARNKKPPRFGSDFTPATVLDVSSQSFSSIVFSTCKDHFSDHEGQ